MTAIIFDIETAPLAEDRLRQLCPPFDPASVVKDKSLLTPFDPGTVKYGLMKDEAKRAEKREACQRKHAEDQAAALEKIAAAEGEHWEKFVKQATLSAATSHVAAIGYHDARRSPVCKIIEVQQYDEESEARALVGFWKMFVYCQANRFALVGHYIAGFDVPYLMRRSWLLGVTVPQGVLDKDKYLSPVFVDTLSRWKCGVYGDSIGLGMLAQAMCVGSKPDDCDGAGFWKLWYSGEKEKKETARMYLLNDLDMSAQVAFRMGIA